MWEFPWLRTPTQATRTRSLGLNDLISTSLTAASIQLGPHCLVPSQEPLGFLALLHLAEGKALVVCLTKQREELPIRISRLRKLINMDVADPGFHQLEILENRSIRYFFVVRIPAEAHLQVVGGLHNGRAYRRVVRPAAVDLQPDRNLL